VNSSYVSRMVNLTTLAPDIVAAILDETLLPDVTLFELAVDPPALWEEQRAQLELGDARKWMLSAIHPDMDSLIFNYLSEPGTKFPWGMCHPASAFETALITSSLEASILTRWPEPQLCA
jgi:hypothetical protein